MSHYAQIRELIVRVRRRWRTLQALQAMVRAALAASVVIGVLTVVTRWTPAAPVALTMIALLAALLLIGGIAWSALPLRAVPDDRQVARFIEEREPSLDDRLVSAVDVGGHPKRTPA